MCMCVYVCRQILKVKMYLCKFFCENNSTVFKILLVKCKKQLE